MYKVKVKHLQEESFADFFDAKARATHLYLQGYSVEILHDESVIVKFMHIGELHEKKL